MARDRRPYSYKKSNRRGGGYAGGHGHGGYGGGYAAGPVGGYYHPQPPPPGTIPFAPAAQYMPPSAAAGSAPRGRDNKGCYKCGLLGHQQVDQNITSFFYKIKKVSEHYSLF